MHLRSTNLRRLPLFGPYVCYLKVAHTLDRSTGWVGPEVRRRDLAGSGWFAGGKSTDRMGARSEGGVPPASSDRSDAIGPASRATQPQRDIGRRSSRRASTLIALGKGCLRSAQERLTVGKFLGGNMPMSPITWRPVLCEGVNASGLRR